MSYHGYTGLGHGSGRISLSAVDCNGTESSLLDCKYETMDSPNCTHSRDVGISCGKSAIINVSLLTSSTAK